MRVQLTTIDKMVETIELTRLDLVKMDIEGAEREALKGARRTLDRFRPRLALDSYHRADDMQVFRELLPGYGYTCGPCERAGSFDAYVPHITFWQPAANAGRNRDQAAP